MQRDSLTRALLNDEDDDSPLLPHSSRESLDSKRKNDEWRKWLGEELSQQLCIAGPMILVNLLQFSLTVVSLMFVGHLGELELSSSQIAVTTAQATGLNVMIGLGSGLETLCGQAYGAKEYRLTGIFLQRAIFLLTLIGIPISFVWWRMGPILVFIGQDPAIAEGAEEYIRLLIPTLFGYALLQPLVKFLQTQSAVKAMVVLSAITLAIHVPLCYLVIYTLGFGFRGAAIVTGISQWINALFIGSYIMFSSTFSKTWTGLSTEAFQDIFLFFKVAFPSAVMICLEFWCFDLLILISGLLPNPQLETSSLSVCLNSIAMLYMIPYGLSAAVSTRVSNKLGAGLPYAAKAAVKLTMSVALIEGVTVAFLLLSARNIFPYLFSSEPDVVSYVSNMVPFLSLVVILDSIQGTLSGVARGCGWQHVGAYCNLCAFYGIGIPVGLLLTFHFHLHGYGLWGGIIAGQTTQVSLLSFVTCTLNWQKLADEAAQLVHGAKEHLHSALPPSITKVDLLTEERPGGFVGGG
ncbi:hypothetical protein R1sor_015541 [Riccia sorocarpa]|uniref:Protein DETOXIFICATION n=1 Tax=Riccia sorocarpa TaxID=122646 RepID=A0ABD3HFJ6_9MARC